jgi:hypothetical protein
MGGKKDAKKKKKYSRFKLKIRLDNQVNGLKKWGDRCVLK